MKKMSKILCSVLVMCGAFSMSAMSVYATGDILIDEPMEMEEAVTTIVSSEIIESGELPVINEDSFQKEKYFNVHLKSVGLDAVHEKVKEQGEAENIRRDCDGKEAIVKSVKTERKTVNPPHLYDLTTLQREANRLYGFTAQQTLDYTQSLYEMKLVTYPRTDSQYITGRIPCGGRNPYRTVPHICRFP